MTRTMAKEILAQWQYQIRISSGLEDYGSEDFDKKIAEQVLQFFENEGEEKLDALYNEKKADFEQFRCIYDKIEHDDGNALA